MKRTLKSSEKENTKLFTLFYLFLITSICNAQWFQLGEDIKGEQGFYLSGNAVDMSADGLTIITCTQLSKNYADNLTEAGSARVYKYIAGTWQQQGETIKGKQEREHSGYSVSMSSDGLTVAIGAPDYDGLTYASEGKVRVYKFIDGNWEQQGEDIIGSKWNLIGGSVSLSDDGLTVAMASRTVSSSPKIYVYRFTERNWVKLDGDTIDNYIGYNVSLSADGLTLAIGNQLTNSSTGRVSIIKFIDGNWVQQGADINGEIYGTESGASLSLSADGLTVAIGAPKFKDDILNYTRVFKFLNGAWVKQGQTIYGERNSLSGFTVSLSDDGLTVVIGAPASKNSKDEEGAGVVKVFKLISGQWEQKGQDLEGKPEDAQGNWSHRLGYAVRVSADGNNLIAGARGGDERSTGYARIYQFDANTAGVEDVKLNMVQVFPNPTKGEVKIKLLIPVVSEIRIVDIHGRLFYANKINGTLSKINLSNFNNGIYFLNVKNDAGTTVKKIILEK